MDQIMFQLFNLESRSVFCKYISNKCEICVMIMLFFNVKTCPILLK